MAKKTISEIREEPGMSNAGKYKNVSKDDFCGPKGTYPVNSLERAKSALKLAHNAKDPEAIKSCVYTKFPELKKGSKLSRRSKDGASMKSDGDKPAKQRKISERKYNRKLAKADKSQIKRTAKSSVTDGERGWHGTQKKKTSTKSTSVPNKKGTKNFVKEKTSSWTEDHWGELDRSNKTRYYKQKTKK